MAWKLETYPQAGASLRAWLKQERVLVWAMLAAFILRFLCVLVARSYEFPMPLFRESAMHPLSHYSFGYEAGSIARSLALGEGFSSPFSIYSGPTAWLGPVYPGICAAIFRLFGIFTPYSGMAVLGLNSIFAAFTCWPVLRLGQRLFSPRIANWSVWCWALVPYFWRWPATWAWEMSLSALLLTWMAVFTLRLSDGAGDSALASPRDWARYGALWGFAALTNPALLSVLLVFAGWLAYRHHRAAQPWFRNGVLSAAIFMAVIAPWLLRNYVVFHQFVFIRGNAGVELRIGNYHGSNGMGWPGPHPTFNRWQLLRFLELGERAYVAERGAEARKFIRTHPAEFAATTWARFRAFWSGEALNYQIDPWKKWMYWPLSLLAGIGMAVAIERRLPAAVLMAATCLIYPIPYYITFAQVRYRHAIEPILLLFAVFWVLDIAARMKKKWL